MESISDILRRMRERPVVPVPGTPAAVAGGPYRPDSDCPHCHGTGERNREKVRYRSAVRSSETGKDEYRVGEQWYTCVCWCVLQAPEMRVQTAEACGLGLYLPQLPYWTLERFHPEWAQLDPDLWRDVDTWAAAMPGSIRTPGGALGWVFRGTTGLGKTHLAVALCNRARIHGVRCLFVREVDIAEALQATYHGDDRSEAQVLAAWQMAPLLAIDDLGKAYVPGHADPDRGNAWLASRLYSILDARLVAGRPTIISTDRRDDELPGRLGEALCDRLDMLPRVEFVGESRR